MVVGIVALVVLVAFVLGRLTPSSTGAAGETTTTAQSLQPPVTGINEATWTVEQIATERQFNWFQEETIDTWPLGLFEVDDTLLLFGSPTPPYQSGDKGIDLWASPNSFGWASMGQVISSDLSIHQIVQSENRFVASGSSEEGTAVLLTSPNGVDWSFLQSPVLDIQGRSGVFDILHVSDDLLIVNQVEGYPDGRAVENALPDEWRGDDVEWYVDESDDGPTIVIDGPLGITVARLTPGELGLSGEDMAPFTDEYPPVPNSTLWTLQGAVWSSQTLTSADISKVHLLADGRLVTTGYSWPVPATWSSADGRSWVREEGLSGLRKLNGSSLNWRGGMITSDQFEWTRDLLYTSDYENWESLGVADLLPDNFDWWFEPIAAVEAGVAMVAETFIESGSGRETEPAVIESGEFSLRFHSSAGSLALWRGEDHVVSILIHNSTPQDVAALDFEERTLTILDPDTDEALVTFDFDEIRGLARDAETNESGRTLKALLYTTDGEEWLIQELDPVDVGDIIVLEDRIVISTIGPSTFRPNPEPRSTAIWVGTLP